MCLVIRVNAHVSKETNKEEAGQSILGGAQWPL